MFTNFNSDQKGLRWINEAVMSIDDRNCMLIADIDNEDTAKILKRIYGSIAGAVKGSQMDEYPRNEQEFQEMLDRYCEDYEEDFECIEIQICRSLKEDRMTLTVGMPDNSIPVFFLKEITPDELKRLVLWSEYEDDDEYELYTNNFIANPRYLIELALKADWFKS